MAPRILVRAVAILLLLMAGVALYACDVSDACVFGAPGPDTGCDDPGGDACLCCCHHVVPILAFSLQHGEVVCPERPPEPVVHVRSAAFPIYHPPQV